MLPSKPQDGLVPTPNRSISNYFGADFDASAWANAAEFTRKDLRSPVAVDPENSSRTPTGSSVLDADSLFDDSGRSFHGYKEGKYFLPNDGAEQDRLDLQHAMSNMLMGGKLYWAPIKSPEIVLDVATGTGIWAIEFARQHPESRVIGTDLSSIQPDSTPPNCTFIKEDSEEEWLYGSSENPMRFDYVHLRWVFTCFNDPRKVIRHSFTNLKPGGWIEYFEGSMNIQSVDGNVEGTALKKWGDTFIEGMAKNGRDLHVGSKYKNWLIEEGFVDVFEARLICPGNSWPSDPTLKLVGKFMLENAMSGFRGVSWKVLKGLGMTSEAIETLVEGAKKIAPDPSYRWFYPCYVVYGRKPLTGEVDSRN